MRFLVTGATGKVGNAVTRLLGDRGHDVVALVRDPDGARLALPSDVEPVQGDVTDRASCRRAAEGVDGVFNCMGIYEQWVRDPRIFERVNAEGAANVIAAAREAGVKRAVHTSTMDVFHAERGGTVSEAQLADYPKGTPYERSKQRAEELVLAEGRDGIEVVIVNPGGVYGPGRWAASGFDSMLRDAIRRRLPALPPGGAALGFVEDIAEGHAAAFERGDPGERYILAGPFATPRQMCAVAVEEAGRGWVPPTLPGALAGALAGTGELVSRLVRRPPLLPAGQLHYLRWAARANTSKAEAALAYRPTPWEEGVRRTVRWMRDGGRI